EGFAQDCTRRNDTLSQPKPTLFIIAGPLGAGKTTFYEAYLKEAFPSLVPAVRHQQQPYINDRRSFAVEDIRVDTQLLATAKTAQAVPDWAARVFGKELHASKQHEEAGRGR